MSEANEYGNSQLRMGVSHAIDGVSLWVEHPETKVVMRVFTIEPGFAREIAMNLTLESFKVEELRERKSSGG